MSDIAFLVRTLVILLLIALTVVLVTRRLAVPYTLGLVVVGLIISLASGSVPAFHLTPDLVLFVFLPALLFEGAWSISVRHLKENWRAIFLLAVPGLLLALVVIALPLHFFAGIAWEDAFLLAAILSPTDPVAVLGLFRQLHVNLDLATIIEGESLFNDGVAGALYQIFLTIALLITRHQALSTTEIWLQGLGILVLQAGGGILIGMACGFLISRFVSYINDSLIETTITIVTAYGVYLLADWLHASGILAVIIAGLWLGSYGRTHGMSERTLDVVDNFWSMVAFVANALLFLLVGEQLNPVGLFESVEPVQILVTAGLAVLSVLIARMVMVMLLPRTIAPDKNFRAWRLIIFWSGLRGALSIALVLALPVDIPQRETLIFATYAVVFFTLLVQGFSLRFLLRRLPALQASPPIA